MTDQAEAEAEVVAPFWTVAIYLADLAYGGPEEGGWWYEAGSRIDHDLEGVQPDSLLKVFAGPGAEEAAYGFANALQATLDEGVNKGRRELSSVLSDGRYYARAYPGHPPRGYPERRPYYE